jgi:acyl-coenzyme A synthetase/AMP-(fatty) acid ligase
VGVSDRPVRRRVKTLPEIVDRAAVEGADVPLHFDRPLDAFPERGCTLTYAQAATCGRRLADGLRLAGVRRGERVAIVKRNHFDTYLLTYAAMRIGAVPALISPELDPAVARELLLTLGAPLLVTDPEVCAGKALRGVALEEVSRLALSIGGHVAGAVPLELDAPHTPPAELPAPDSPALITHTSGTTDVPKLALQSHRTLAANWSMVAAWFKLLRVRETVGVHLPFPHIRMVTGITSILLMRWSLVALTDPTPGNVDAVFSEHRPGVIETFPNTFILWEQLLASPARPLSSARWFLSTFDAMHPRTLEALLEGSSHRRAAYAQLYGQTETGPITWRIYTRRLARHADGRCVGYSFPAFSRVRIAPRAEGNGLAGRAGDILVRSPALVLGYVGRESHYHSNFREGWWRMTDIGHRSRWGCLHLHDREIDSTSSAASLLALEDVLLRRMPDLLEGVLVPTAGGELAPILCTREDAPLDLARWSAAIADLPTMAAPRHCRWEDVPQTATWKVRRVEARRLLERGELRTLAQ